MEVNEPQTPYSKSYWKAKAFEWLRQKTGYQDFDLDKCLGNLERIPECREAALAAFWGTYLASQEPPNVSDEQIGRIRKILENPRVPDMPKERTEAIAFVNLHLAGVLIVSLISPDHTLSESPTAIKALETGLAMSSLTGTIVVEDFSYWGSQQFDQDLFRFSDVLVSGITFVESALWHAENGEYEEAFSLTGRGYQFLCLTISLNELTGWSKSNLPGAEGLKLPIIKSKRIPYYLPHSGKNFNIQEAADIFEVLKSNSRKVKDWGKVREVCQTLDYTAGDLYDQGAPIRDGEGNEWAPIEYWVSAVAFAECQMSPSELQTYKEEGESREAERRLKRDFFDNLWETLEPDVRELLVEIEIHWDRGQFNDVVMDLRPALEKELAATIPVLKQAYEIPKGPSNRLVSTRMLNLLKEDEVRDWIKSHTLAPDYTFIVKEIPSNLWKVINARNCFEHKDDPFNLQPKSESAMIEDVKSLRKTMLGIGCEGVLVRLAKIKSAVRGGKAIGDSGSKSPVFKPQE